MKSRMSLATVRGKPNIYASEDHVSPRADWANIPSGKMEPASACSTIRRKTNITQNWTKGFTQKKAHINCTVTSLLNVVSELKLPSTQSWSILYIAHFLRNRRRKTQWDLRDHVQPKLSPHGFYSWFFASQSLKMPLKPRSRNMSSLPPSEVRR